MKFVCENCKAKYQIGDDKVSGKTVRMKCRRCGHLILVSATVTESSVAKHAPAEGAPLGSHAPSTSPPQAATPAGPALTDDEDEGASTVIMTAPAALRVAPTKPAAPAGPARPAPPAPRAGGTQAMPATTAQPPKAPAPAPGVGGRPPPPKPSAPGRGPFGQSPAPGAASPFVPAAAPSAPSVADLAQRSMSSAISAAARGTSNPLGPGRSGGATRGHLALAPTPPPTPSQPQLAPSQPHLASVPNGASSSVVPPSGGVAGAFQRVAAAPAPALRIETPGEDWYVGVGGVPIGPVRLSVIREKVEQGAVDGESLVWREGFEEWQPLRNVPGLRAILDEPRRTTSPTPPPDGGNKISSSSLPRVSATTNGQHAAVAAFGAGSPAATPAPAPSHASATVGAAASAFPHTPDKTAEPAGGALGSLVSTGGVALGPAASAASDLPLPPPPQVSSGQADPAIASAAAGLASKPVSIAPPRPASLPPPSQTGDRRKGMHPFAYAMIAMAAVFGGVAAWVLLIKAPPEPVVVVKTVTADPGLNAAPPPPPSAQPDAAPTPSASADPKAPTGPIAAGGPRPSAAPSTKPGDAPPVNADSFGNGPSGPVSGPGTTDNGGGNGKLSEGEIQGVVSRNQSRVRKQCWQPALDASSANGPKSASVKTSITIGPGGNVTSASASGADNFPGLASCVGGAVRQWTFPKSDGPTTVNIPFSFNAQ